MSHAYGQCRFGDGLVLHFEYNGTGSYPTTSLRDTEEDVTAHWRQGNMSKCTCGKGEPVVLATAYGAGMSCESTACRYCRAISGDVFEIDCWEDGLPDWWMSEQSAE